MHSSQTFVMENSWLIYFRPFPAKVTCLENVSHSFRFVDLALSVTCGFLQDKN